MRNLLSKVFPCKRQSIMTGISYGLVVSLGIWLPLPASIQPTKSWLPFLYAALGIIIIVTLLCCKHDAAQDNPLGWKGLGFILAGIIYPLIPLGSSFWCINNPKASLYVGIVLIIMDVIRCLVKLK